MKIAQVLSGGLAAGALVLALGAGEAAAQERVNWKMQSTYGGKLTQLGTAGIDLEKTMDRVSGGQFRIKFFEPKALVPELEAFDAVAKGAVDAAWSTPGYWYGKEKSLAIFASVPFGPSAGEYLAWMYYGGGHKLLDEVYAPHGIKSLICGVIAPEASGWFRKEIKTAEDLKGLKMRFFGLGAKVMEKMGVSTQLLAAGDIYPALERGTIDATEFSMPAIDLSLGFHQVAKHYYFPGWHQQSTLFELMMNKAAWEKLPQQNRDWAEAACGQNISHTFIEGEAIQFAALTELKAKGVQIHTWSPDILSKLQAAWGDVAKELAAEDPKFAKAWASLSEFRKNYAVWKELGYLK